MKLQEEFFVLSRFVKEIKLQFGAILTPLKKNLQENMEKNIGVQFLKKTV
jgi:hypothetical protein